MSSRLLTLALILLAASSAIGVARAPPAPPWAMNWSPTGVEVPLDAPIVITWSQQMNASSVEAAFLLTDGATVWNRSAFQWVHATSAPWTSRASPRSPYPRLTVLTATVNASATDGSGQRLDQNRNGTGGEPTDRLRWTFRTESGLPPRVVATNPANNATGVAVVSNLTIAFDKPMNGTSVAAAYLITPPTAGALTWNANFTTATFDPELYLRYATTYRVLLNGSTAKDGNGHPLDGNGDGIGGDDYAFSFVTEPDVALPRVTSLAPLGGASNVSVTADLELRFSEPMDRTSVEAAFSYTDGTGTWNRSAGAFGWSGRAFPDDTASFDPFQNLPFSATITVTLRAAIARDPAGNPLDGNGDGTPDGSPQDDVVWSFAIETRDLTPPTVVGINPANGATDVRETTGVTTTFSEAMNATTVEDGFSLWDAVRTWTGADGSFVWGPGGDVVAYTPAGTLSFDSVYHVAIAATAADVSGNRLGTAFGSTFRTRPQPDTTPPRIVATIPSDGDTGIDRTPNLSITFDDSMDAARTDGAISLANASGPTAPGIPVGGFAWDAVNHTVSFRPLTTLGFGIRYRVSVSQFAQNAAGLALSPPYAFAFTTASWSGRVIGRVVDQDIAVAGATVILGNQTTLTSENGTFVFPSVLAGTYNLTVEKAGYAPTRITTAFDERLAGADGTTVDLGTIRLQPAEGPSILIMAGILFLAIFVLVAIGLVARWRRGPPQDLVGEFDDWEEEPADAER